MKKIFKNIVNPTGANVKDWLLRLVIDTSVFSLVLFLTASSFDHTEIEAILAMVVLKIGK